MRYYLCMVVLLCGVLSAAAYLHQAVTVSVDIGENKFYLSRFIKTGQSSEFIFKFKDDMEIMRIVPVLTFSHGLAQKPVSVSKINCNIPASATAKITSIFIDFHAGNRFTLILKFNVCRYLDVIRWGLPQVFKRNEISQRAFSIILKTCVVFNVIDCQIWLVGNFSDVFIVPDSRLGMVQTPQQKHQSNYTYYQRSDANEKEQFGPKSHIFLSFQILVANVISFLL